MVSRATMDLKKSLSASKITDGGFGDVYMAICKSSTGQIVKAIKKTKIKSTKIEIGVIS